jgi:HTH-type transcriptional regulator/antitoxin HipB
MISLNPRAFGIDFKATRKALGLTQQEVAQYAKVRRETIIQLERGENVGLHVFMMALAGMGKGVVIVDARPEGDQILAMLDNDDY